MAPVLSQGLGHTYKNIHWAMDRGHRTRALKQGLRGPWVGGKRM